MSLPLPVQIGRRGLDQLPEVALAPGPSQLRVTGNGSYAEMYGYAWASILDPSTPALRLFQVQDAAGNPWPLGQPLTGNERWVEVPVPALAHDVRTIRHHSLAFDQAGEHVFAYELEGQIWVRQWDGATEQYVLRGPFAGVDPVLLMDSTAYYRPAESDVLLFYTPDRRKLAWRYQLELYATEHVLLDNNGAEVAYTGDVILDQVLALPYRYEICLEVAGAKQYVYSRLYPLLQTDKLAAGGAPLEALSAAAVLRYTQTDLLAAGGAPLEATYDL